VQRGVPLLQFYTGPRWAPAAGSTSVVIEQPAVVPLRGHSVGHPLSGARSNRHACASRASPGTGDWARPLQPTTARRVTRAPSLQTAVPPSMEPAWLGRTAYRAPIRPISMQAPQFWSCAGQLAGRSVHMRIGQRRFGQRLPRVALPRHFPPPTLIRRPTMFSAPGMSSHVRSSCLALFPADPIEVRKRRAARTASAQLT
jgi:hypothetical protein